MAIPIASVLLAPRVMKPQSSGASSIVPYQALRTEDGWIVVGAGSVPVGHRRPVPSKVSRKHVASWGMVANSGEYPRVVELFLPAIVVLGSG